MSAYESAVAELFARQPNRMVPDLDRITALAELLGRPDQAFPSIHITGTNGKTSTAFMVSRLLGMLGLTAGGYTSPHLQDVRERIRVAGRPLSHEQLREGLDYLRPYLAEVDTRYPDRVTFFEVLTALAFVHFADAPVDVGVFEVGMGGQWDATNLVNGQVAVLTQVGIDHPELGATAVQVAAEKVGIVKDGAAVVSAAQEPAVEAVICDAVERHGGRMVLAGRDFEVVDRAPAVGGQLLTLRGVTGVVDELFLPLYGAHQAENAACALAAVEGLLGFAGGLDLQVIRAGFAAVRSPGRCEVVRRDEGPPVVLDGAHNPAGVSALAVTLSSEFAFRNRIAVLGVLSDKDIDAIAAEVVRFAHHVVVTQPPSSRAATLNQLEKAVRQAGGSVEVADEVGQAIELASGLAADEDAVVVTGSLYTVGAARDALGLEVV
ncbi:MAG: bifunctional folylpolyglutamate synthase/dihydrofolate synthase [Egibacteraceae bacterium]